MKKAMMEVVAGGAVTTVDDVQRYVRATLLAATQDFQVASEMVSGCLHEGACWCFTVAEEEWCV